MSYRNAKLPPEADRSLLVVGLQGMVHGLARATGEIRWSTRLPGYDEVFLVMRYEVVVVSDSHKSVGCLDYQTGAVKWAVHTTGSGRATIVVEPDCIVVAKSGYIDCFGHTGAVLWTQPLKGMGVGRAALGFPGNFAQADERGS